MYVQVKLFLMCLTVCDSGLSPGSSVRADRCHFEWGRADWHWQRVILVQRRLFRRFCLTVYPYICYMST
jgi:hypothetical protein